MVKPHQGGSALGAQRGPDAADIPAAWSGLRLRRRGAGRAVRGGHRDRRSPWWTDGRPAALPAVEIVPDSGVFDYESRYTAGLTTYYTPARLSRRCRRGGGRPGHRRPSGTRPAGRLAHRCDRRRRRPGAVPRGQCVARSDRDIDAPDVGAAGRRGPGRRLLPAHRTGHRPGLSRRPRPGHPPGPVPAVCPDLSLGINRRWLGFPITYGIEPAG